MQYTRMIALTNNELKKSLNMYAKRHDLTGLQLSLIDYLAKRQDKLILQRDIENEFNIQRSTATTMLQLMENKGLIQRRSSTQDARQKQVTLTAKGQSMSHVAIAFTDGEQRALQQAFTVQELATFEHVLNYIFQASKNGGLLSDQTN